MVATLLYPRVQCDTKYKHWDPDDTEIAKVPVIKLYVFFIIERCLLAEKYCYNL